MQVKEDSTGNVKIASSNAGKDFAAEEISAQVLRKLTDDAAKFLNDKVFPMQIAHAPASHIKVTILTILKHSHVQGIKFACISCCEMAFTHN